MCHNSIRLQNKICNPISIGRQNNYEDYSDKHDLVYVNDAEVYNKISRDNCVLKLPRINEHLKDYSCKLLVSDLGSVYKYKNNNIDTDFSLNVTNSYSVAFLHSYGVNKITLSY